MFCFSGVKLIHLSNLPLNCQFQAKLQEEGKFIVTLRENVKKEEAANFHLLENINAGKMIWIFLAS